MEVEGRQVLARLRDRLGPPLGFNPLFDREWYLERYPDVRGGWIPAQWHYRRHGWREGRRPNAWFDPGAYLAANPDVVESDMEPLEHYLRFGRAEGRALGESAGDSGGSALPQARELPIRRFESSAKRGERPTLGQAVAAARAVTGSVPGLVRRVSRGRATQPASPPGASADGRWAEVRELCDRLESTSRAAPSVLVWRMAADLGSAFPDAHVFRPPEERGPLPYLDGTVDVVIYGDPRPTAEAEARRVASAAVVDGSTPRPQIVWRADAPGAA